MIDSKALGEFIEKRLSGTDIFLVSLKVTKDNDITVELDSENPLSIEVCENLSREIEQAFDRDEEDYTLEVGSAGLTSPLQVPRQYKKYIGQEMEVITKDGKKLTGILERADEEGFTLRCSEKIKKEGQKRPVIEEVERPFSYTEIKQTKYILKF